MTTNDVNQRLDIAIKEVDLAARSPQQRAEVASIAPLEHIMEVFYVASNLWCDEVVEKFKVTKKYNLNKF